MPKNGDVSENLPVLSRPRQGAVFGGVCAGLARRLGINPVVLRIIAIILTVALGGLGVALYLAGMLLIPREGEQVGALNKAIPVTGSWPRPLLTVLVVALAVAVTWGTGGAPTIIIVAVIGVALWVGQKKHTPSTSARPALEPTPFERASSAWQVRLAEHGVDGFESVSAQPHWEQPYTDPADRLVSDGETAPIVVAERRHGWRLWGLALALTGLGTGVVAILGLFGLPAGPWGYAGATLLALGVTSLVSSRNRRPPLLIAATSIAAIATVFNLMPQAPALGDVRQTITTEAELPESVIRTAGNIDLDLSGLNLSSDRVLTIKTGAGDVHLRMPAQTPSELRWNVGLGDASVDGNKMSKVPLGSKSNLVSPPHPGPGLQVNVEIGAGDLEVQQ